MSAQVLGRAQMAPLLAMCTIPGETPNARSRAEATAEKLFLIVRLARAEILRRSEMRERAFELNVAAIGERACESARFPTARCRGGSFPC